MSSIEEMDSLIHSRSRVCEGTLEILRPPVPHHGWIPNHSVTGLPSHGDGSSFDEGELLLTNENWVPTLVSSQNFNETTLSLHSQCSDKRSEKVVPPVETMQNTENIVPQVVEQEHNNLDPKRLRRVMQSRQYSQKYRVKQLHYIAFLESELKSLQAEVAITSPKITESDRQNSLLREENYSMRQKLFAFSEELKVKEGLCKELKRERDMLREIHDAYKRKQEMQEMMMENNGGFINRELNDQFVMNSEPGTFHEVMNQNLYRDDSNPFESTTGMLMEMNPNFNLESYNFI